MLPITLNGNGSVIYSSNHLSFARALMSLLLLSSEEDHMRTIEMLAKDIKVVFWGHVVPLVGSKET